MYYKYYNLNYLFYLFIFYTFFYFRTVTPLDGSVHSVMLHEIDHLNAEHGNK